MFSQYTDSLLNRFSQSARLRERANKPFNLICPILFSPNAPRAQTIRDYVNVKHTLKTLCLSPPHSPASPLCQVSCHMLGEGRGEGVFNLCLMEQNGTLPGHESRGFRRLSSSLWTISMLSLCFVLSNTLDKMKHLSFSPPYHSILCRCPVLVYLSLTALLPPFRSIFI